MENRGAREREERDKRVGVREREERDLEYRGRRAREDMDKRNTGRERKEMNMESSYKMSVPNQVEIDWSYSPYSRNKKEDNPFHDL